LSAGHSILIAPITSSYFSIADMAHLRYTE
jgi:hypothetical protein